MGICAFVKALLPGTSQTRVSKTAQKKTKFPAQQRLRLLKPHNTDPEMLTNYRNFFSRTVKSHDELNGMLASVSRNLKCGAVIVVRDDVTDYSDSSNSSEDDNMNESDDEGSEAEVMDTGIDDKSDKPQDEDAIEAATTAKVDSTNEEETDGEYDEEDEEARAWAPIRAIEDSSFIALIQRIISPTASPPTDWNVERRKEGSFNQAVIIYNGTTHFVVKVPIVATPDRWQEAHAKIMRSEVHTMTYIKSKLPHFPIPEVVSYSTTFDNEIGAPFVVQSFVEGKSGHDIWYEKGEDGMLEYGEADSPSEERDKMRVTFLKSLAKAMAELRGLEFEKTGMLYFEDDDPEKPTIGEYVGWDEVGDESTRNAYFTRPTHETANEYYTAQLDSKAHLFAKEMPEKKAVKMILETIFKSAPFNASKKHDEDEKETFVLRHDDLALQNILCSDTGEVVGIIDWEKTSTVPRCVGYSSLPLNLQEDWEGNYVVSEEYIHSPWTLNKYRKIYSDAMTEACGVDSDAKYSQKSHIYGVIQRMLYGDRREFMNQVDSFVPKLLVEFPELRRVKIEPFLQDVGNGWEEAELVLGEGIRKFLNYRNI